MSSIEKNLDLFLADYGHIFLLYDFKAEFHNYFIKKFWDLYNLW